jgi:hypothetical protein
MIMAAPLAVRFVGGQPEISPPGSGPSGHDQAMKNSRVMFRNLHDNYIAVIFRKPFLSPPFLKGDLGGLSGSYL